MVFNAKYEVEILLDVSSDECGTTRTRLLSNHQETIAEILQVNVRYSLEIYKFFCYNDLHMARSK